MSTIDNGRPVTFTGDNPVYNGKTGTITESYVSNAGTGAVRYKVRWDSAEDQRTLQDDIGAEFLREIIVNRFSVTEHKPLIGTKIRVYGLVGPAVEAGYEGAEGVVTRESSVSTSVMAAEVKSLQKPDDTIELLFEQYEVVAPNAEASPVLRRDGLNADDSHVNSYKIGAAEVVTPANATYGDLYAVITALSNDLAQERTANANRREVIVQMHNDFDAVGEALKDEAENRNWCDEYDQFVERVNAGLTRMILPVREQEYEVEVEVTGTLTTTTTVFVTATSQEAANEMVDEDMDSYVDPDEILTDAARNVSFDIEYVNIVH